MMMMTSYNDHNKTTIMMVMKRVVAMVVMTGKLVFSHSSGCGFVAFLVLLITADHPSHVKSYSHYTTTNNDNNLPPYHHHHHHHHHQVRGYAKYIKPGMKIADDLKFELPFKADLKVMKEEKGEEE